MSRRSRRQQRQRQRAVEQRDRTKPDPTYVTRVLRPFDQLVEQRDGGVRRADEPLRMRPMRSGYFWLWREGERA